MQTVYWERINRAKEKNYVHWNHSEILTIIDKRRNNISHIENYLEIPVHEGPFFDL